MTSAPRPARQRWWRLLLAIVVGLLTAAVTVVPATASGTALPAGQRFDLTDDLMDEAGALLASQRDPILMAQSNLRRDHDIRVIIVFVSRFDGLDGAQWADRAARANGLNSNEALLAVAVDDRRWGAAIDESGLGISSQQRSDFESAVEARLRHDLWGQAALDGLASLADAKEGGSGVGAWVLGLPIAGVGLLVAGRGLRRRQVTRRRLAEELVERQQLAGQLATAQVALDDAIASARHELAYADADFGSELTNPFRAVLEEAEQEAVASHRTREKVGELDRPGASHRGMTQGLRTAMRQVNDARTSLAEQVEHFTELRELKERAPQRITELRQDHQDRTRKVDDLGAMLSARTDLSRGVVLQFAGELEGLSDHLAQLAAAVDQAAAEVSRSAPQRAVADLLQAQQTLATIDDQWATLTDIDKVAKRWQRSLLRARRSVTKAVKEAHEIATDLPEVMELAERGERLLTSTDSEQQAPLEAADQLDALGQQLDQAIAGRRAEVAQRRQATRRAQSEISTARRRWRTLGDRMSATRIRKIDEFHDARRRSRRLLTRADELLADDPDGAYSAARQAAGILARAIGQLEHEEERRRRNSAAVGFSTTSFSSGGSGGGGGGGGGGHTSSGGRF